MEFLLKLWAVALLAEVSLFAMFSIAHGISSRIQAARTQPPIPVARVLRWRR